MNRMKANIQRPEIFGRESIDELLEVAGTNAVQEVVTPIEIALDKIRKSVAELKLLPGVDRVIVRIQTLQDLLDSVKETLEGSRYKEILRSAGERTGISFAEDLVRFLKKNGKLPANDEALICFWIELDNRANWGKLQAKFEGENIVINVQDNFLTRGLDKDRHRHCAFMEGYIQGFLWTSLKDYNRWFTRAITRPAMPPLQPVSVVENPSGDQCTFVVKRTEEVLRESFDRFYDAKEAFNLGQYKESAVAIRTALESALRGKIGLDMNDRIPCDSIIGAYRQNKNLSTITSYNKVKDIWGSTSAMIHGRIPADRRRCEKMLTEEAEILKSLELSKIGEKEKKEVLELLAQTKK